jgi:hypothetical protein
MHRAQNQNTSSAQPVCGDGYGHPFRSGFKLEVLFRLGLSSEPCLDVALIHIFDDQPTVIAPGINKQLVEFGALPQ